MRINRVFARQVLNSRGSPTIEAIVFTKNGAFSGASPSGVSTGEKEAVQLSDGGKKFSGLGVQKAVKLANTIIAKKIVGAGFGTQKEFDEFLIELDGTKNKSRLGGNTTIALSIAFFKALSAESNLEHYELFAKIMGKTPSMPVMTLNFIEGGAHAGNNLPIQEYMVAPYGFKDFETALEASTRVFVELKALISRKLGKSSTCVGDEGGYAVQAADPAIPLMLLTQAISTVGEEDRFCLAVDAAASEFYKDGKYVFCGKTISAQKLGEKYASWTREFNVKSIEDPFAENNWGEWTQFMKKNKIQVVGDDLVCTQKHLVEKALEQKAMNASIIKLNQVGTITETLETLDYCFKHDIAASISHRGGETNDSIIADLAVGTGAGQCKFGGLSRGERVAKYNRLMEINEKENFAYRGKEFEKKYC